MNLKHPHLRLTLFIPLIAIGVLWIIESLEYFLFQPYLGLSFSKLGVFPRSIKGIPGIIFSPFIHGSWDHLIANTTPLFILLAGLIYFYKTIAFRVVIFIYLLEGFWVWATARQVYHIGASGVIYGLAFFLFFSGVFRRDIRAGAVALIVALFYGSMVWGVFPLRSGMSWESHLFGAIAGILVAFHYRNKGMEPLKSYPWQSEKDAQMDNDVIKAWDYQDHFPPPEGYSYPDSSSETS